MSIKARARQTNLSSLGFASARRVVVSSPLSLHCTTALSPQSTSFSVQLVQSTPFVLSLDMQTPLGSSGPVGSCATDGLELTFLGTGTSSSLPQIQCITAGPNDPVCKVCLSSLSPEGRRNARRNTSAAIRAYGSDGQLKCVYLVLLYRPELILNDTCPVEQLSSMLERPFYQLPWNGSQSMGCEK